MDDFFNITTTGCVTYNKFESEENRVDFGLILI